MKLFRSTHIDVLLLIAVLAMIVVGSAIIYSASSTIALQKGLEGSYFIKRHLTMVALGSVAFFVAWKLDYSFYFKNIRLLFWATLLLTVLVFTPLGHAEHGAKRWLNLFVITIQPSEILKLFLFGIVATKLADINNQHHKISKALIRPIIPFIPVFLVLFLQPSYSMIILIALTIFVMIIAAGVWIRLLIGSAFLAVIFGATAALSATYRKERILAHFNPDSNLAKVYQQTQSVISLGNGGFNGVGIGMSTQKQGFLPMPFTDMIYSIIGEELGFIGTTLVMGMLLLFIWRGLAIARSASTKFGKYLATAITANIGITALLHIAVNLNVIPNTGQPFPMVSFGGTSFVITLFSIGILMNISNPDSGREINKRMEEAL